MRQHTGKLAACQGVRGLTPTHFWRTGARLLRFVYPTQPKGVSARDATIRQGPHLCPIALPRPPPYPPAEPGIVALGILRIRDDHLTLSEIARSVPTRSGHIHKLKRIHRFLASAKWSPADLFPGMLHYLLQRFRPGQYLPVIIDQSTLAGRWEVL